MIGEEQGAAEIVERLMDEAAVALSRLEDKRQVGR